MESVNTLLLILTELVAKTNKEKQQFKDKSGKR
jgi:hypothetical protein